ncbi:hypothetical protein DKZ22_05900 [Limosilactobacillus reuteri]|uniref:Uncharacterized protein n=1 Tax=Limosilactobacillus reuteri TaxID=1598 RepID=A0A855XV79_LIMRT|nr:hypothetical protein DKZ24_07070 [Limosilactobacillus reuteri]PWT41742.1 hypothetical protein DKZ22_05900 [Limosilactobacillus reuteri]PWT54286.1 hypothetical protein DKZ31_06590 [Limosilactobacillus reuteri]PWT59066.1 hypothetical protein DKZ30_06715 [Limosilactobacillus reuteri]PWT63742.1 hypothetical protein DKZ20_06820 [Limosilactobacillus reuteri]
MRVASETYDYEPFDNTDHTMKQIADAIRHKGYGKDVREAIAQGFEKIDSDLARITIKNKQLQNALGLSDDDLNNL